MQVGAGQPEPRGLPRGTALLVATGVPHDPHMAVHALEDRPEDTGHLVVHQRGGPAWLKEHVTALRSWASTVIGAEIRLHDHPAISPGDTRALSMDQLTHSHPDVRWHSTDLNAGWLSPTGYYWIPEAWGHTSSDASGGGPCKHATSVALTADITRTWAVAISGTVPDGEGVAASLPPTLRCTQTMGPTRWTPKSSSTSCGTADREANHGGPRGRSEGGQPDAP